MPFYNFVYNADGGDGADELYIDGEIAREASWWGEGGEVIAREFRQALARCRDVTVWINSPGGDVFAGAEIYTALKEHKGKVTVKVMGLAGSAASTIAMAGDEVLMSPVAYMIVHNPWGAVEGDARKMDNVADVLRELGEGMINAYAAKTGKSRDEIAELLNAETLMSAQTCVDEGFADGIIEWAAGQARNDGRHYAARSRTMMRGNRYGQAAIYAMVAGEIGVVGRDAPGAPSRDAPGAPFSGQAKASALSLLTVKDQARNDRAAKLRADIAARARLIAELQVLSF